MLVQTVGLREIPPTALRLVVASSAHDRGPSVLVDVLVGPLPDVSHQVHDSVWACTLWERVHVGGLAHVAPLVRGRDSGRIPVLTPRVGASVGSLRRVLPFPFVRQALSRPCRVSASILERNPSHRFLTPALRVSSVFPVAQKIVVVLRMVFHSINELLKLGVGHRVAI